MIVHTKYIYKPNINTVSPAKHQMSNMTM